MAGGAKREPRISNGGHQPPGPDERRGEVEILDPPPVLQTVIRHEFGHMIGLGDEYPEVDNETGLNRPAGAATAHSELGRKLMPGQGSIVAMDGDNIMSDGNLIRPHHYVTLLEAIGEISATTGHWRVDTP
jgi:hypothetical protein